MEADGIHMEPATPVAASSAARAGTRRSSVPVSPMDQAAAAARTAAAARLQSLQRERLARRAGQQRAAASGPKMEADQGATGARRGSARVAAPGFKMEADGIHMEPAAGGSAAIVGSQQQIGSSLGASPLRKAISTPATSATPTSPAAPTMHGASAGPDDMLSKLRATQMRMRDARPERLEGEHGHSDLLGQLANQVASTRVRSLVTTVTMVTMAHVFTCKGTRRGPSLDGYSGYNRYHRSTRRRTGYASLRQCSSGRRREGGRNRRRRQRGVRRSRQSVGSRRRRQPLAADRARARTSPRTSPRGPRSCARSSASPPEARGATAACRRC